MTENLDNILDEVKMYDGVKPNPAVQSVNSKSEKPVMETETRNYLLKGLVFMAVTAGCAVLKLMHPVLYIPLEIGTLCAMCVKYGEWKGRKGC